MKSEIEVLQEIEQLTSYAYDAVSYALERLVKLEIEGDQDTYSWSDDWSKTETWLYHTFDKLGESVELLRTRLGMLGVDWRDTRKGKS